MHSTLRFACVALATLFVALPRADAAFPPTALKAICLQQIHSPTNITHANDGSGRIFVCDQPGVIYIIQGGMLLPTPFLDIQSQVLIHATIPTNYSERGLLGMAFHPDFTNSSAAGYRKFFLYYSTPSNLPAGTDPVTGLANPVDHMTVLSEFQVSASDPNVADPLSERRILSFNQPQTNHNGGQVEFGPDGFLYLGTGDGGGAQDNNGGHLGGTVANPRPTNNLGNGLSRATFLGKILRINPLDPDGAGAASYSIPASNPFVNDPDPANKKEIFAWGLRNPWKFCFDKRPGGTNRLFCGDVGQGRIEEINLIVSGGNYGWRYLEGLELPSFSSGAAVNPLLDPGFGPYIPPIAMYAHPLVVTTNPPNLPQLGLSVTGGYVYRGGAIPTLQGKYVFGDYGSTAGASDGRVMGLEETAPGSGVFTLTNAIPFVGSSNPVVGQRILCLGEDQSGEIYIGMKTKAGVKELDAGLPSGGIWKIVPPASATLPGIEPLKDTTIFSDGEPTTENGRSNGNGSYLFAGFASPNGFQARRALLAFDLSSVPNGATVTAASVSLYCSKQAQQDPEGGAFNLHRVTSAWGEGVSNSDAGQPGAGAPATVDDATWRLRMVTAPGTPPTGLGWTTHGGDYTALPSASTTVNTPSVTPYVWSSTQNAQLVADVNAWLATPSSNNGWILIGPETGGATAKQFISRESFIDFQRPKLNLTYAAPPAPTHFETWLATYFPSNLVGQFVNPKGDVEGDGIFNLIEYAYGYSPLAANLAPASGLQVSTAFIGANTVVTITFRRDPRATDLNYYLETGSDLVGWTILVQSLGGDAPTGPGFNTENPIAGSEPVRLVRAVKALPTPARHFVRLRITQQ